MADHSLQRETLRIAAPVAACVAVASDLDEYPLWAPELKDVAVRSRDEAGNPLLVDFRIGAFGRSTSYTLRYDFSGVPEVISWVLESGELTTKLDGSYRFVAAPDDPEATDVHYELEVELVVPLPNIVKQRAELKIIHTALRDLKARVESLHSAADG